MPDQNAMAPWADPATGHPLNPPLDTLQPAGVYIRRPQFAKFFTYLHRWEPMLLGAVGQNDAFQIDGDADFHILKQAVFTVQTAGGPREGVTVRFQVSPIAEAYNIPEMFLSHLGSGQFPTRYDPPIVLPRNSVFQALVSDRNLISTAVTIFIAHFGAKVYRNPKEVARQYKRRKPFTYVASYDTDFTDVGTSPTIPAGSTAINTIRLGGEADFDVQNLTVVSDAPITLQVMTGDDQWFNRPIRGELLGGSRIEVPGAELVYSGALPFYLPVRRLIPAAGYINVTVTNLDAVNPNRVQIGFHGTRLYSQGV